jgi:hypothetical protein
MVVVVVASDVVDEVVERTVVVVPPVVVVGATVVVVVVDVVEATVDATSGAASPHAVTTMASTAMREILLTRSTTMPRSTKFRPDWGPGTGDWRLTTQK